MEKWVLICTGIALDLAFAGAICSAAQPPPQIGLDGPHPGGAAGIWIGGLAFLAVIVVITVMLRNRTKKGSGSMAGSCPDVCDRDDASTRSPLLTSRPKDAQASCKDHILLFFLNLFKFQNNIDPRAPSEITLIEDRPTCPNETYELRALHKGEWVSRRMSIGLLGQGGGSRSQCYYVIFDTHLVIKIPTDPITDLKIYSQRIASENAIVARLAPRPCIVPGVGIIARSIRELRDQRSLSDEKLEEKFFRLMRVKPAYQEYLKIGGSFVFFMDLAKHFFLSTILMDIHGGHDRLVDEAIENPDLLWDHQGFVHRYGECGAAIRHELLRAYTESEAQLRSFIDRPQSGFKVPDYVLKQWFLRHLVGEKIPSQEPSLPGESLDQANQLLDRTVRGHRRTVDQYRLLLRNYIRDIRFSKHRRHMEGLATNTLELLNWINAKGLALRDLKPENLFVSGNPGEFPLFLNDPEKFSIGLIDVETAVVIDPIAPDPIRQPQLAGTPLFATPSHLLSNAILTQVFGDLRTILHLQDWYASLVIIYKIVTGQNLFTQTAHTFPEILAAIKRLNPAGGGVEPEVAKISRIFWNSAEAEFRENLQRHQSQLSCVETRLPDDMVPEISGIVERDIQNSEATIHKLVSEQSFFSTDSKVTFLKNASAERIGSMRTKLHQEALSSGHSSGQQIQLLRFFEELEGAKREFERLRSTLAALSAPKAMIPADLLLKSMFQRVFSQMYLSHWPCIVPNKWAGSSKLPSDIVTYQATL